HLALDRRSRGGPLSHHPENLPASLTIECIGASIIQRLWDLTLFSPSDHPWNEGRASRASPVVPGGVFTIFRTLLHSPVLTRSLSALFRDLDRRGSEKSDGGMDEASVVHH